MRRGFRIAIVTVVSLIWGGLVACALVLATIIDSLSSLCTDNCKPTHHLVEWAVAAAIVTLLWIVLVVRWLSQPQPSPQPPQFGRAAQPATFDE